MKEKDRQSHRAINIFEILGFLVALTFVVTGVKVIVGGSAGAREFATNTYLLMLKTVFIIIGILVIVQGAIMVRNNRKDG